MYSHAMGHKYKTTRTKQELFWTYSEVLSFHGPRPPPTHPQADKTKKSVCFVLVWHVWQEVQKRNNEAGLAGLYSLFPHVKTKKNKGRGRRAGSSSFHKYHIPLHSNGTKWIRTIPPVPNLEYGMVKNNK